MLACPKSSDFWSSHQDGGQEASPKTREASDCAGPAAGDSPGPGPGRITALFMAISHM